LALAFALCSCAGSPDRITIDDPADNLVLIVIDTLRQDRVSAYGYERQTTPVLDRLAADGAVAYGLAPTSWTKPSTASILTGLHPLRHQAYGEDDKLPGESLTLAEILHDATVKTFGISANLHITAKWGFDQGFDHFKDMGQLGYGHVADCSSVNEVTVPLLDQLTSPFFLYVHYVDPHVPYDPPAAWDGSPLGEAVSRFAPMDNDDFNPLSFRKRPPDLVAAASDLYDGEVRDVDTRVGELIEALRAREMLDQTLVVITSDHGEEFEDHGRMGHGHTLYSDQIRVPLIFYAPELIPAGTTVADVSLLDIVPTTLDLMGLGAQLADEVSSFDGESVVNELFGVQRATPKNQREFLYHLDHAAGQGLGLQFGDLKLNIGRSPYLKAVFDVRRDPREQRSILNKQEVQQSFDDLAGRLARRHNDLKRRALDRATTIVDAETNAQLRALGYAGTGTEEATRIIPETVSPPDRHAGGLLGWEEDLESCFVPGSSASGDQGLLGWYDGTRETGRWTYPRATAALRVPHGSSFEIQVDGINHRPGPFDLTLEVDGAKIQGFRPEKGEFSVAAPLTNDLEAGANIFLSLSAEPPFLPSEHGSPDKRILGVFVEQICVVPVATGTGPTLAAGGS
jgi:arylsulfatase